MIEEPKEKKDYSRIRAILIAFVVILLIINGVQFYLRYQHDQEMEAAVEERDETITIVNARIDSIYNQYQLRMEEIQQLGGDTASMGQIMRELEAEKEKITKNRNYYRSRFGKIQSELEAKIELLKMKDEEIAKLQSINEQLMTENTGLKEDRMSLTDSVGRLSQTKKELSEQVEKASKLNAVDFKFIAVNKRGKEREGDDREGNEFKDRHIQDLKVSFKLADNPVAKKETKEIYVRVIQPDGSVLYDLSSGGGTFQVNGDDLYYTMKQDVLFDNSQQRINYVYTKGSDYNSGTYTVEAYSGGRLIGSDSYKVK